MPVSEYFSGHGSDVMSEMLKHYGREKGLRVFYATANKNKQKPKSFKKGGIVPGPGKYKLHGGELVLPHHLTRKLSAMLAEHSMEGKFKG